MRSTLLLLSLTFSVAIACSSSDPAAPSAPAVDAGGLEPVDYETMFLPPEPQRSGDPQKGYQALVNEPYVPCGIPYSAFRQAFAPAAPSQRIPGRVGRNEILPYNFTAMTTKDGVELVTSNCLVCHAGRIDGQLVVGLGAADSDFTIETRGAATAVGTLLTDPKERAEWEKWKARVDVVAPYSMLSTRGPNPADGFTAALFAHHDPKTLSWSDAALMPVPPPMDLPVDVPPWWRMKKKSSMFYNGAGRGDHARIMMTASILCSSSVEESRAIDAYFADVRAYITSIAPPKFPFPIDASLAEHGRGVFEKRCATCHGTYGETPTYPNKLVPLAVIGTDALLASGTAQFGGPFVDWYKASFFGEAARLEPKEGYVAPPLDGIWATAPYLHNGSVPTIAALLDSASRPAFWTRSFDSKDYDPDALGWRYTALDHGKAAAPKAERPSIYDTSRPGYGNTGHLFGDVLSAEDRAAVIEYLKTL